MKSKVIWLTGASSGIGEAFARRLAKVDCKIAITARNSSALDRLVEELSPLSAQVLAVPGDVSDLARMKSAAAEIEEAFEPIDIIVANAGTHIPTEVEFFDSTEYEKLMKINFSGALYCIEAVLPGMIARKSGHVVGVSSVAGYRGLPKAAAYGASKAALTHFLDSLRLDLEEHGVAVSIVSPGFVKTPLTDKNDFEMPFLISAEEAAEAMYEGICKKKYEIHFPKRFTFILKALQLLPRSWYHRLIRKTVKTK